MNCIGKFHYYVEYKWILSLHAFWLVGFKAHLQKQNLSYLFKMVLVLCQISFSKSLVLLGKFPSVQVLVKNPLSSLVTPSASSFIKISELLGTPKCIKFYQNLLSSLVPPSASSLKSFLLEIRMSRFPIASNFSCSVLSITGDTAKYLDFYYLLQK